MEMDEGSFGAFDNIETERYVFCMGQAAQFPMEQSETGEFKRQEDSFREWISNDSSTSYPAVSGRYHLYASLAYPWASRALIVRV